MKFSSLGIGRSWKFLEPMEPIQSWGEFQDLSTNTGAISIRISTGWTLASLLLKNPKTGMRGQSFLHQINLAIWNRNWCVIPFCGTSSPSACMTLCVPSCRFQCGMTHWNLVGSDKKWFCLTIGHPKNHRWIIIFPIKLLLQKSQKWEGFQLLKNWPVSILPQTRKKITHGVQLFDTCNLSSWSFLLHFTTRSEEPRRFAQKWVPVEPHKLDMVWIVT